MGPLAGIRVLDLSTVGPGSRCAALLADLGADVVKIGPPPGTGRIVPEPWAYGAGRGCRRLSIDLGVDGGRDAFLALAAGADVVVESFRPGVAERLGIGPDAVPHVVYARLTGYGQDGPYADWAGHDLNYQAVAGVLSLQGRRADGGPALPGATFADSAGGGMHGALAIAAALVARASSGVGTVLDVAAVDGVLWCASLAVDEHLAGGPVPRSGEALLTGAYACYDVYRCSDDGWLSVAAIEPRFFANLCAALGLDELADRQYEAAAQAEIRAALAARFATRDRDAWVADLAPKDTCVAPVLAVDEVVADPHIVARGHVTEAEVGGVRFPQLARVIAGSERPSGSEQGPDPARSDARELLAGAGVDAATIEDLLTREVVA